MCGIAGFWGTGNDVGRYLAEALSRIRHRGPDDEGKLCREGLAMGMRRLAILDVPGGSQPVFSEAGDVAAIFNGEIYNFREIRTRLRSQGHVFQTQCDSEVLVHLYEEAGVDMCRELRGMFAFAIWDARRQRLLLARDRLGKKPLYFTRTPGHGLIFASELEALRPLMASAGLAEELNPTAIYDYLSFGSVPQPSTIYKGVESLPPATWLLADESGTKNEPYWSLDDIRPNNEIDYNEAVAETKRLVSEAVGVRLHSDVPIGVLLSGGVDSSVVAFEAARCAGARLQTFTVAMEEGALDESPVARRTAHLLGVHNHVLQLRVAPEEELFNIVTCFGQPFADSSAIAARAISRLAREHVTVVLNGDGGDEVFGGYRRHVAAAWHESLDRMPHALVSVLAGYVTRASSARRSLFGFTSRFLRGLPLADGARYLHWTTDLLKEESKRRAWIESPQRATEIWLKAITTKGASSLRRQMRLDMKVNLLSDLLVKMDMATMLESVEARSPLLDHHVVEFAYRLPDRHLIRGMRTKPLLRDAYAAHLPKEVIRGKKKGFEVPLRRWLRGPLQSTIQDLLGSGRALVHDWLDKAAVEQILHGADTLEYNTDGLLYALLVLEIWLRQHTRSSQGDRALKQV